MNTYCHKEEYLNSYSHYLGAGLGLIGGFFLIKHGINGGTSLHILAFGIFTFALILLYSMSGTYHILHPGKTKDLFKILDHSAIYILISGSYTPYLLTVLKGPMSIVLLVVQWSLTIMGILFKIKYAGRFKLLSTLIYLFMGWMIMFMYKDLKEFLNPISLKLLFLSGIAYSGGTIFYMMKKVKYSHMIWHLFVLAGSIFGYLSIFYIV